MSKGRGDADVVGGDVWRGGRLPTRFCDLGCRL